ncbi:MAG: hypothetical protein IT162_07245 [Bryobacterales bacterium]|nr:hypothetical protein [Bryobacterales bacterium]
MKKFQFPLESALLWRRRQMETEQARLEELERQRVSLAALLAGIEQSWAASAEAVCKEKVIEASELETLANYRIASDHQKRRVDNELRVLAGKVHAQKAQLVEATRQFRLIEKLKDRRKEEWQHQVDAQLEQEAGELYLAQWINQE